MTSAANCEHPEAREPLVLDPCPGTAPVRFRRDQCPSGTIEHIKESVLGCMKQCLANLAIDHDIRQNDLLAGSEVPHFARSYLVVPHVFSSIGFESDDTGQQQVVATFRTANLPIPGRPVTDSDVEQVELWVVDNGIPNRAATSEFPPLARPCLSCLFENRALKWLGWISRHGVEAPNHISGLR